MASASEIVRSLQDQIQRSAARPARGRVTSGSVALDRLLSDGGLSRGTLVEWLGPAGCAATTLAMIAAREAVRDGRALVVVDRARRFYPPAAVALGITLEQLVVVGPRNQQDLEWALTQGLRCPAVGAVVAWPDTLSSQSFRRLQLAAETGGGLGLLVRPAQAVNQPSWAEVRLRVQGVPTSDKQRVKVELLRCRGGHGSRSVELEIDDETHTLHLASKLAPATTDPRSAEA